MRPRVTARSNLAYAHQLAGDIEAALPLFEQVLAERQRLYGPEHSLTELAQQLLDGARADRDCDRP